MTYSRPHSYGQSLCHNYIYVLYSLFSSSFAPYYSILRLWIGIFLYIYIYIFFFTNSNYIVEQTQLNQPSDFLYLSFLSIRHNSDFKNNIDTSQKGIDAKHT